MSDSLENNQSVPDTTQEWRIGQSGQRLKPGLYIVATPIGNLRDITLRALDILAAADKIYCEDTRVTQRLLSVYGIQKQLERCDDHTEQRRAEEVVTAIREGQIIVFVSDAGTPGISDPGVALAAACHAAHVLVSPVPGPSAAIAAVSAAGITKTSQFLFLGFLPPKSGARRKVFHAHLATEATLVLYEAPQRVKEALEDIQAIMGERQIFIGRELTKLHETLYRGTPSTLMNDVAQSNFKGEVVLLILPSDTNDHAWDDAKIDQALLKLLDETSLKEAVAKITAQSGLPRKVVYARALGLDRNE